jgi:hypothetical protein
MGVTGWLLRPEVVEFQERSATLPAASAAERLAPAGLALAHPAPDLPVTLGTTLPRASPKAEPTVALDLDEPGAYRPPQVIADGAARVYPLTRNVWVRPKPSSADSWIGFLWFGSSVRLREAEPRSGPGCAGLWHGVEPRGYVCVDDRRATLDPDHPVVRGVTPHSPQLASAWPHRYGESIDLRRYAELPSERTQRAREWYYREHQALLTRARAGVASTALLGIDLDLPEGGELVLPTLPRNLQLDRDRLQARSTVAWSREQLHAGRSFLLSADLKWVPKDRVRVYPTVTFEGVHLGRQARLPLAFFRERERPSHRLRADGRFERAEHVFTRLSWVELSGRSEQQGQDTYLETRHAGLFVRESDAVVPRLAATTPWGTALDAPPEAAAPGRRGRSTWIEVSIFGGWLLAYEGQTPVFATLVSAGRGGAPQGQRDAVETASTPVGRFKITGKFATATMVSPTDLVHSDVPWAQNFSGPHALHAAYWHDGWGELRSGGCLNVSPADGRWLFQEFSEPRIPDGWHGVRWLPSLEPATSLIIRR